MLVLFIYFFEVAITNNNFVNDDKRSYKVPKIVKYHTECDISFLVEVCIVPDAFLNNIFYYQNHCGHHRTYIDEFVIAAEKSRFWIDCIPKIEILAFDHVGKVIHRNCFCAILHSFRFLCTFVWFNCYCFLSLCLMSIWILNKIIYENSSFSHNVLTDYHKTNPLSWRRSCYCWSWAWCRARGGFRRKTTEKIIFCRWFLCWCRFRCSRITNLYILKKLKLMKVSWYTSTYCCSSLVSVRHQKSLYTNKTDAWTRRIGIESDYCCHSKILN